MQLVIRVMFHSLFVNNLIVINHVSTAKYGLLPPREFSQDSTNLLEIRVLSFADRHQS